MSEREEEGGGEVERQVFDCSRKWNAICIVMIEIRNELTKVEGRKLVR